MIMLWSPLTDWRGAKNPETTSMMLTNPMLTQ